MKKTLINDSRLTPTMQRTRSGATQLFREKNKNDRSFINSDNCDVSLEHENKEMYAELIDDKWYWVSGCAECNGKPRDWMTYIECDKHNRCSVCSTKRKDIIGSSVWASKKGWICNDCKLANDFKVRLEAFDKLNGEEPDTLYRDQIICPHCGSQLSNDDMHESGEFDCCVCEGKMYVDVNYTLDYTTSIIGNRITK